MQALLSNPFDPITLAETDTPILKSTLLKHVEERDTDPMAKKVRFANDTLMPLFNELEKRNPTPDLKQQIPLLKGTWVSVWSTNPFQDIIPGRIQDESYQIFDDKGYYANLARYKPGRKAPLLSWISRWLLSYDLMIMQSYAVETETLGTIDRQSTSEQLDREYWDIQNVCIQQVLRFGSLSFNAETAQNWFDRAVAKYQQEPKFQQKTSIPTGLNRLSTKQYQQISQARPQLDNLYIDRDFRLVKTQREKSQRPSYTVAIRLV